MKRSSNRFVRLNVVLAFCLVGIGLLVNPWLLGRLPGMGNIPLEGKIFIWAFEILFIISGLLVGFKGNTPEERKHLLFGFIGVALTIVMIETGLHVIGFVIQLSGHGEVTIDKRYLFPPYQGKEWVAAYISESAEQSTQYEQFLGWAKREYHGRYINVDSHGVRETWNPEHFHGEPPRTLYMFGGSTVWGAWARDHYTIPSYLSKLLNSNDHSFIVHNYGEDAYTFTQEVVRLMLLLREGHRPDYVVFYDGASDVYSAYHLGMAGTSRSVFTIRAEMARFDRNKDIELIFTGLARLFRKHCMIYRAIGRGVSLFPPQQEFQEVASTYTDKELQLLSDDTIEYYLKSMDLLDHLAQAYDFKYICFWQPVIFTEVKLTDEEVKINPRLNDKTLAKLCHFTNDSLTARAPHHFFNISDALSDRTESCYIDAYHLSEEGNELVATKIVSILEKEFLLKK